MDPGLRPHPHCQRGYIGLHGARPVVVNRTNDAAG